MKYSPQGILPALTPPVLYFIRGNYLHQLFNQLFFFKISKTAMVRVFTNRNSEKGS
jgi:hypothetical protein